MIKSCSEAVLASNDYGWKSGIPIESLRIIPKHFRWYENRKSIAAIATAKATFFTQSRGIPTEVSAKWGSVCSFSLGATSLQRTVIKRKEWSGTTLFSSGNWQRSPENTSPKDRASTWRGASRPKSGKIGMEIRSR